MKKSLPHGSLRSRRQAADVAVKIDFADAKFALAQGRRQHAGEVAVECELGPAPGADRTGVLAAMADIDRDQRRRGKCYGRRQKKAKTRNGSCLNYPGIRHIHSEAADSPRHINIA
jgi:hypothetical protein